MRFYYDLDLGKLVTSPGFSTSINLVDWKRGDASQITLGFYRGTQQVLLEGTPQLKFALKPSGQFDADPVVSTDSWTLGDESNKDYIANPSFNTVELNALFNHADGDPTNDLEKVSLMFEFTWSTDGGSTWTSTETVKSNVYNDVIKGTEGVPLAGSPAYPGPEEIQVLSEKGQPDGYASLGSDGKVPASELPSYVDDVLEYADLASFPGTGDTGKIYVALDSGLVYRWSGSTYVQIAAGDHSHSNLAVLDATTASFTAEQEAKLAGITGTNTGDQDLSGLQPILAEGAFVDGDKTVLDGLVTSLQSLGTLPAKTLPDSHTIDLSLGRVPVGHLGANTVLTLTGANEGDSGMIILGNGTGHDGVGYTVSFSPGATLQHSAAGHEVMVGDLADFAVAPAAGEYNFGSIAWFYTGDEYLLYVSEVKPFQDVVALPI